MDLIETDKVESPALLGFLRPRLLLPPGMLDSFSRQQLRYFFLHELSHFKRGDIPANWVMGILQVLHWFNPFVWLAFSCIRADRETACDAHVIARCDAKKKGLNYGAAILDFSEFAARPNWLPGVVGILEDKKQIKRRIRMIASYKEYPRWTKVLAIGLMCALGLATFTDALSPQAPAPTTQDTSRLTIGGQLVLIDSAAVAAIEEKLNINLDPATGRTLLTQTEAVSLREALLADKSAHLVGEGSSDIQAGGYTQIRSVNKVSYNLTKAETRLVGWMHDTEASDAGDGPVKLSTTLEWNDLLGTRTAQESSTPLFQTYKYVVNYSPPPGGVVLLRGSREPLKEFKNVAYADSLSAQLKGHALHSFLFLAADGENLSDHSSGPVPGQVVLTCQFLSMGASAQKRLRESTGMGRLSSSFPLTARAYGELTDELDSLPDTQVLSAGSIVNSLGSYGRTDWNTEVIYWDGTQYETRKCGFLFTATPTAKAGKEQMDLALTVELTYPPEKPAMAGGFSPRVISTSRNLEIHAGQTILTPISAPGGLLPSGHKCYLALTGRMLGEEHGKHSINP